MYGYIGQCRVRHGTGKTLWESRSCIDFPPSWYSAAFLFRAIAQDTHSFDRWSEQRITTSPRQYPKVPPRAFISVVYTYLGDSRIWFKCTIWQSLYANDVSYGALTPLWAGVSPEGKDLNGKVRTDTINEQWCIYWQEIFFGHSISFRGQE
jgi:hypothetical protein